MEPPWVPVGQADRVLHRGSDRLGNGTREDFCEQGNRTRLHLGIYPAQGCGKPVFRLPSGGCSSLGERPVVTTGGAIWGVCHREGVTPGVAEVARRRWAQWPPRVWVEKPRCIHTLLGGRDWASWALVWVWTVSAGRRWRPGLGRSPLAGHKGMGQWHSHPAEWPRPGGEAPEGSGAVGNSWPDVQSDTEKGHSEMRRKNKSQEHMPFMQITCP